VLLHHRADQSVSIALEARGDIGIERGRLALGGRKGHGTIVPMSIEPESKDWTWVIERECPQCGFVAPAVALTDLPDLLRDNASQWTTALAGRHVRDRPDPATWSPLEYACHVRDVHRVFGGRFALVLAEDDPQFENWDQDQAAVDGRYGDADPAEVGPAIVAGAEAVAAQLTGVPDAAWERPGRRSNGSGFTLASLARYYLHDVVHHLWDVQQ